MDRPLFSDMLVDRRRQLGLSIKQASNVLRLKEEVLIAFEEGDFDSIPKSGYAQGMLSSYARYLGLNAKTVVNQFSQDLFEHERGAGSHEARRRNRQTRSNEEGPLYETPQAAVYGRTQQGSRTYVESHGFLPTSGGFAGDMSDFATTSRPRPRYASRSESDEGSSYDASSSYSAYPQGRPYTSRVPVSTTLSPLGQSQRQRPAASSWGGSSGYGVRDQYGTARPSRQTSSMYSTRDEVTTRRVMPSQYRDDMRLDNDGSSYQSASSMAGRRSSRNIASTERPNVRRRSSSQARAQMRGRERVQSNSGGIVGMLGSFFQERSRVAALIVLLLFIVLMATLFLSVSSCINNQSGTGRTVSVTTADDETTEDTSEESTSETDMTDEEEKQAREAAAAAKAAENESSTEERTIEVNVADGEVTWLEIEYDGYSDVAETVTGPWNRTYTVRQSISINVNDTSAVTVTEDGKKLEFESKASGIGTITIQVSKKGDATNASTAEGDQSQNQDQTQTQTQDGQTTTGQPTDGVTGDQTQQTTDQYSQQQTTSDGNAQQQIQNGSTVIMDGYTLDEDGYYYGADGYYDASGTFYSY